MGRFGTLVVASAGSGEVRYGLDSPQVSLGRGAENDVVVLDIKVSRRHAVLRCTAAGWRLEDVGSSNGFKVNGQRVREADLGTTDEVLLGATRLTLVAPQVDQESETVVTGVGEGFEASLRDYSHPRLVVTENGQSRELTLTKPLTLIGRSTAADIQVDHPKVSRQHVEIALAGGRATLKDLGSRNGTLLRGQPVSGSVELASGDTFEVGDARIVFKDGFTSDQLSAVRPSPLKRPPPPMPRESAATGETTRGTKSKGPAREDPQPTEELDRSAPSPGVWPPNARPVARAPRPAGRLPVVVVPGFMGSTLYKGNTMVWPAAKTFLKAPEFLKLPEERDLDPRGLVEEVVVVPGLIKLDAYNRLVEYLIEGLNYQLGHDLFIGAYDWRLDLRLGARTLGSSIAEWEESKDKAPGKFILLAHSAGGLVSRYYVERMGGRHHVERLILLGTPNQGTGKPLVTLLGAPSLIPFGANRQKMKETMGTFLSAYQLLPTYPMVYDEKGPVNVLEDETWIPEKARPALGDALNFYKELGATSRVPVVSIFGYGQKTLARVDVKRNAEREFIDPKFTELECGDGTVAQDSAILPGSEIHPVQQQHGALYTDNDVKMRLKLELLGRF